MPELRGSTMPEQHCVGYDPTKEHPRWSPVEIATQHREKVCKIFGISKHRFHSKRRTRTLSRARWAFIYLMRRDTDYSYPELGEFFLDGMHHTSVLYGHRQAETMIDTDPRFAKAINS